jgi:hypothetical protein
MLCLASTGGTAFNPASAIIFDEFAASYSLADCSPAESISASPAGSIFNRPAQLVNRYLRQAAAFSTGIVRDFQQGVDTFTSIGVM